LGHPFIYHSFTTYTCLYLLNLFASKMCEREAAVQVMQRLVYIYMSSMRDKKRKFVDNDRLQLNYLILKIKYIGVGEGNVTNLDFGQLKRFHDLHPHPSQHTLQCDKQHTTTFTSHLAMPRMLMCHCCSSPSRNPCIKALPVKLFINFFFFLLFLMFWHKLF